MSKVTLQGYIVVPDSDLPAVQDELPKHIELTKAEEGCLIFQVTQDTGNKNIFNVYEVFINRNAFESHQDRIKRSIGGESQKNQKGIIKLTKVVKRGVGSVQAC